MTTYFYGESLEQAKAVVSSIEPVTEIQWSALVAQGTIDSVGFQQVTTTTVIAVGETAAPAVTGTRLTDAWRESVHEVMVLAEFDVLLKDIEVFEEEMDRGLVHATITTGDGNECVLAFGPWREGENFSDPEALQEHFFAGEAGQESSDGLLFHATERTSPPHYVYLAMDEGKISISVEPLTTSAEVPDLRVLEELALHAAPTVRYLLETHLSD